jgi:hypothetical protein
LVAERESATGEVQLLSSEPAVGTHERSGAAVELGDVAATVGDHHARPGVARGVPVRDEATDYIVAALADDEAPALRIHLQRLVDSTLAQQLDCVALPRFTLAPVLAQDDRVAARGEHAKGSAGFNRGELTVVAD